MPVPRAACHVLADVADAFLQVALVGPDDALQVGAALEAAVVPGDDAPVGLPLLDRRPEVFQHDRVLADDAAQFEIVLRVHRADAFGGLAPLGRIAADAQRVARLAAQQPLDVLVLDQDLEVRHAIGRLAAHGGDETLLVGLAFVGLNQAHGSSLNRGIKQYVTGS